MARILIIDADPVARERLIEQLAGTEHELVAADSGERGLDLTAERSFDLVLLDVLLPGLHGFETATRLQRMAGDSLLPIMLVTALKDHSSRTLAFRSGADDFLTKPVDTTELRARVENLLARRRDREALIRSNAELRQLHQFKEELSAFILHDLKNPLAGVLANLEMIGEAVVDGDADVREMVEHARLGAFRMLRLLRNLLDGSRLEADRFVPRLQQVALGDMFRSVFGPRKGQLKVLGLAATYDDGGLALQLDPDLMTRVLDNILDNALRYTPRGGAIELVARSIGDHAVALRFGNTGPPIDPGARTHVFEKYGQLDGASRATGNLGLGMYFCRLAVEAHGGHISIEEEARLRAVFCIELPRRATS